MENLRCHPGRFFTLDGLDDQAKAEPEAMPRELNEWREDRKEDYKPDWLPADRRAQG